MKHIKSTAFLSLMLFVSLSCSSTGELDANNSDSGVDTESANDTDAGSGTNAEVGLDQDAIKIETWGDCTKNNWSFEPPVTSTFTFVDNDWTAVQNHGYLRKLNPYYYLDIQTWNNKDEEFSLNTDADLSSETMNIYNCKSCVRFYRECTNSNFTKQECSKIYAATSGTLSISKREAIQGGTMSGVLKNAVLQEAKIDEASGDITIVEDGDSICIKEYSFEDTASAI